MVFIHIATKTNKDLIFTFRIFILLLFVVLAAVSCRSVRIKDKLIGKTSIERKYDENEVLIYYKKTTTKLKWSELGYATHQCYITRTTTKTIKDHKTVELNFQKTKPNYCTLSYDILKSKRVVWDENRKKTITHTSKK